MLSHLFLLPWLSWIHRGAGLYTAVKIEPTVSKNVTEAKNGPKLLASQIIHLVTFCLSHTSIFALCLLTGSTILSRMIHSIFKELKTANFKHNHCIELEEMLGFVTAVVTVLRSACLNNAKHCIRTESMHTSLHVCIALHLHERRFLMAPGKPWQFQCGHNPVSCGISTSSLSLTLTLYSPTVVGQISIVRWAVLGRAPVSQQPVFESWERLWWIVVTLWLNKHAVLPNLDKPSLHTKQSTRTRWNNSQEETEKKKRF